MTCDPETVYDELHPYFQKRVRQHESLARHAALILQAIKPAVSLTRPG